MATCSSILAWEIPWTEEPDKLQSMGAQRVGHDLMAESEEELKRLLMKVKEESENVRLEEVQVGINTAGRNISNLRYADDTTLMAESEEELKSLLIKVKEESKTAGLKLNIQKTKIMASGPITSWQIDRETMETV